jgi:hypothetical protein
VADDANTTTHHDQANEEMHSQVEYLAAQLAGLRTEEHRFDLDTAEMNRNRIEENTAMIHEIRAMRAERKELHAKCNLFEQQLRDACVALHRLSDPRRAARSPRSSSFILTNPGTPLNNRPPTPGQAGALAQVPPAGRPPLLPPIDRSLSKYAADDGDRHRGAEEGTVALRPVSRSKSALATSTPGAHLKASTGKTKGLRAKKGLPDSSKSTDGSRKPSASVKSAKVYEKTRLMHVIDELDSNTEIMRAQQEEVNFLRAAVQDLLAEEEAQLISALKDGTAIEADVDFVSHAGAVSPDPATDAANTSAARASSTTTFARPTPGLDDDVDWTVPPLMPDGAEANDGRPMTPTRLPSTAGL